MSQEKPSHVGKYFFVFMLFMFLSLQAESLPISDSGNFIYNYCQQTFCYAIVYDCIVFRFYVNKSVITIT